MFFSTQPSLDDQSVQEFATLIALDFEIRMALEVERPEPYGEELTLVEVVRAEEPWAQPKMCWFNCRDYVAQHPECSIVFGWQILRVHREPNETGLYAFHHAILRTPNGLLDITPDAFGVKDKYSVFLADSRVPFDYKKNRAPASLYVRQSPTLLKYWTFDLDGPEEMQSENYRVSRAGPDFTVPVMTA